MDLLIQILLGAAVLFLLLALSLGLRVVSRRSKAEAQSRRETAMQKAILNSANYAIISTDIHGLVTTFNAAAERLFGYKASEVIGKTTPAPWHVKEEVEVRARELSREVGRTIEPGFEVFTYKARRGEVEEREWTLKRKDGSTFPVLLSITPLEEDGHTTGFLGVVSDLTARKKAEYERDRSSKELQAVLTNSLDGVVVLDAVRDHAGVIRDFRYTMVNPAAEKMMRMPAAALLGRTMLEVFPFVAADGLFDKFTRIVEKGVTLDFEYRSDRAETPRWYRLAGAKLGDGLLVSYAEITVRKEAEEKLRASASRLELATQALQAGVWDWDVRTGEVYWDEKTREIFGLEPGEPVTHEGWAAIVLPEDLPKVRAALTRMVDTKTRLASEYRIRRKDGSIRYVQAAATVLGEGGDVVRVIGVNIDVTNQKERMEALRLSEDRFSSAFEHATTGMALVSPEGQWLKVNDTVCNLLGYTTEELLSRTFQDITHPEDLETDLANVERLLAGEIDFYKMEKRYFHKDGHVVWAQLGVSLLRDENRRPLYFIAQIEDISQIKQALIRQEELTLNAQTAERAKSEFLAMMSHEIRTPMNGVLGYAELLAATPMESDQKEYLHTIITSGEALLRIIDDILDFSRIESGGISVESALFNVADLVRGVKAVLSPKAVQKGVGIEVDVESHGSPWFIGDSGRLRQVLINLAGNALKFTDAGNVRISMRSETLGGPNELMRLRFAVSDTGSGIPVEKLREIFRPFTQADSSIARRYGGTGLGLTISQRLVELMGGSLQVESKAGTGSTFSFTVPMRASAPPPEPSRAAGAALDARFAQQYPLEILVADDDRTNLGLIKAILKRLGYLAHTVPDGHGALKAFAQVRPDCVLLDMHMPEVDGCEVAKRIRRLEQSSGAAKPCYISALTANVLPNERQACLDAGMNDFLSKPFKPDLLAEVLKKAFANKQPDRGSTSGKL